MIKEIVSPFKLDINAPVNFKKENLYPFQKKAIIELEKFHQPKGKSSYGILKIPTGGGKTKTASYWITSNLLTNNYKLVWIAHRKELLEQAAQTFNEFSGILKSLNKKPICQIVVGGHSKGTQIKASDDLLFVSIQTLARGKGEAAFMNFIKKNQNTKILFVIDEAHHSEASTYKYIIEKYIQSNNNYSLLGLTATPTRTVESEKSRLMKLFKNKIIYEVSLTELISSEILAKPIPRTISTNVKFEDSFTQNEKEYFDRYRELHPDVLKRIANSAERNKVIVNTYKEKKTSFGKTIIFATDIIHCKTLAEEFIKSKVAKVAFVHSGKEDNEQVLNDFRFTNKYDILINIEKLTEGFDCPNIQSVFLARPTQSEILFSQMVGRGLRGPKSSPPGTEFCYLVSFMDHWDRFTGWLDVSKALEYSENDEKEIKEKIKYKTETRIIPWDIIQNIYNDLLPYTTQIPYQENLIDYLPHGWYTIEFFDENLQIPTNRKILVFSNQNIAWSQVISKLSKLKKKPTEKETTELYNEYFDDLPIPFVILNDLKYLIDFVFSKDKFIEPDYYTFNEKYEAEPKKLAEIIISKKLFGDDKKKAISNWFEKNKILNELFDNEVSFAKEVSLQTHYLEYPEDSIFKIYSGNPFLEVDKKKLNIPEPDNSVLKKYFSELVNDKMLFPSGFNYKPEISWTNRIMKSYFGIAYIQGNKIKINRLLNEKSLDKNVVKFVLYHEMLHFDFSANHTKEFWVKEGKYKNAIELDSILDNMSNDYEIPLQKKTLNSQLLTSCKPHFCLD